MACQLSQGRTTALSHRGMAVLSCFLPLRRFAASDFPAVDVGHVGIERTCELAETFLVNFKVVNLVGYPFGILPAFRHPVKHIIRAIVVSHASTDVIAVAVPFAILAGTMQDVCDVAAQNLVSLPAATPQTQVAKGDYHAVHLHIEVHAFVIEPPAHFLAPFFIAHRVTVIFQILTLAVLVILPCLVVHKAVV